MGCAVHETDVFQVPLQPGHELQYLTTSKESLRLKLGLDAGQLSSLGELKKELIDIENAKDK